MQRKIDDYNNYGDLRFLARIRPAVLPHMAAIRARSPAAHYRKKLNTLIAGGARDDHEPRITCVHQSARHKGRKPRVPAHLHNNSHARPVLSGSYRLRRAVRTARRKTTRRLDEMVLITTVLTSVTGLRDEPAPTPQADVSLNGGSVCVGASAFKTGTFSNACTTPKQTHIK